MATCKPLAKTGESCMTAPCDTTGTKLVCLPSKACGSPQDDGATCATISQCKSATCTIPVGMTMGTCQPSKLPPKLLRTVEIAPMRLRFAGAPCAAWPARKRPC